MPTPLERTRTFLASLPDDATYLDVLDGLKLLHAVDRGLDAHPDDYVSTDEVFAAVRRRLTRRPVALAAVEASALRRPEDYAPWGSTERREDDPVCAQGCRHAAWLRAPADTDWCVCTNPASHRTGLLTEGRQGCRQFEASRP